MTPDEAVKVWAKHTGPVNASYYLLNRLGLFNERMALESMQDDIDDGESTGWPTDIHMAYAVLREKHPRDA